MEFLLSPESHYLWTVVLALALFYPVRQMIWVLSVRRSDRREGETDDSKRQSLKRRASITAVLLCFVFSFFYTAHLLQAAS